MQPVVQAVLRSWSIPPAATFALIVAAFTYLRGWWLLRRAGYPNLRPWRASSFGLGLFTLWFALASPLDTFSPFVLTAHMLQHMILMMVAPPLILLGEPLIPIVRGMPRFAAREFAGPFLNCRIAERIGLALTNPAVALLLMGTVMFAWHVPRLYELALRSSSWHEVEHACFFFASLIFWWPVVQPWPSRAQWPRWAMVPYLIIADLQNTALSAVLVFSDRVLYPSYAVGPSLFGFPPQEDQAAAGAMMWVVGSLAFIVPAILIAVQCLSSRRVDRTTPTPTRDEIQVEGPIYANPTLSSLPKPSFWKQSNSQSIEAFTFLVLFALTIGGFLALSRSARDDDDQVLRLSEQYGSFAIAVYGPAGQIPMGAASFAVLVQDRTSHRVLLDSEVDLAIRKANAANALPEQARAAAGDENRLLFSADVDLRSEGAWIIDVAIHNPSGSASVSLPIEVVKPVAGFALPWSYIVVLAFAAVLWVTYVWRHSGRKVARLVAPAT
jgi:cytochrome c oxidase assembly factor CtaG